MLPRMEYYSFRGRLLGLPRSMDGRASTVGAVLDEEMCAVHIGIPPKRRLMQRSRLALMC